MPDREADSESAYALETSEFNRVGTCPLGPLELPRGSFLFLLAKRDHSTARCPILVERESSLKLDVRLYTLAQVGAAFVQVPAGPFIMEADPEGMTCSGVKRRETTGDFFISKFEVRDEYKDFVEELARTDPLGAKKRVPRLQGSNEVKHLWHLTSDGKALFVDPRGADWPIMGVSWEDANAFCEWMTRKAQERGEKVSFRLPTSKEWEKAARGADGRFYPWGNRFDWTFAKGGLSREGSLLPEAGGMYPKDESPYGVRDMSGGLQEWCAETDADGNCTYRGANWCTNDPRGFRLATVRLAGRKNVDLGTGFRIVRVLEP